MYEDQHPFAICDVRNVVDQPGYCTKKPNILLLLSDDTGWGDLGPYGGGEGRVLLLLLLTR